MSIYNSTNSCPVSPSFHVNTYGPVSQVSHGVCEKPVGQIVGEMIYKIHTTVSAYLWGIDDKREMLEMVKTNPDDLYWASQQLRNDRDIVTAAVKRNGIALQFASPQLRSDDKIVRLAAKQNIGAWRYANFDTVVRNKKIFVSQLVEDSFARCRGILRKNGFLQEQIVGWADLIRPAIEHKAKKERDQFINYGIAELKSNLDKYFNSNSVERFCSSLEKVVEKDKKIFTIALRKRAADAETVVKNIFDAFKKVAVEESEFLFKTHESSSTQEHGDDECVSAFIALHSYTQLPLRYRE